MSLAFLFTPLVAAITTEEILPRFSVDPGNLSLDLKNETRLVRASEASLKKDIARLDSDTHSKRLELTNSQRNVNRLTDLVTKYAQLDPSTAIPTLQGEIKKMKDFETSLQKELAATKATSYEFLVEERKKYEEMKGKVADTLKKDTQVNSNLELVVGHHKGYLDIIERIDDKVKVDDEKHAEMVKQEIELVKDEERAISELSRVRQEEEEVELEHTALLKRIEMEIEFLADLKHKEGPVEKVKRELEELGEEPETEEELEGELRAVIGRLEERGEVVDRKIGEYNKELVKPEEKGEFTERQLRNLSEANKAYVETLSEDLDEEIELGRRGLESEEAVVMGVFSGAAVIYFVYSVVTFLI